MAFYSWLNASQAVQDLADRLQDPTQSQWSATPITLWLNEALRTWNALTSVWRDDMPLSPVTGTNWYDLTALTGSNRPYAVTDANIFQAIEYHLLEPDSGPTAWSGSLQFNLADIYAAIQRARDEVLSLTSCTLSRILVTAPLGGRISLPDNVIDVRRVAWIPNTGLGYTPVTLRSADVLSKQWYDCGYTIPIVAPPRTFLRSSEPPLSFDVDRVPPVAGNYECLVVQAGAALGLSSPVSIGVPTDWSWVVKWGALAQLFGREGNAKDSARAGYCLYRFNQGIGLMLDAPVVLASQINNYPAPVDAVRNGDDFNASWQSTPGVPRGTYIAGMNLVGLRDPGLGTYISTLTVVENAPLSKSGNLQVSREDYSAVLDYAQHLAALQMGGQEFADTMPLLKGFVSRAALYNSKLNSLGDYPMSMLDTSNTENERNPVFAKKPMEILT